MFKLFSGIPLHGLAALAGHGQRRWLPPGSVLLRQGRVCEFMYIIVRGRVAIERAHPDLQQPVVLSELGPGEVVGEGGLLDGQPRRVTAVTLEPTEVLEFGAPALAETILQFPDRSAALLRLLSERLHSVDELAVQARVRGWSWLHQ